MAVPTEEVVKKTWCIFSLTFLKSMSLLCETSFPTQKSSTCWEQFLRYRMFRKFLRFSRTLSIGK